MISGTNGLLGAADGAFILSKEKRTSNNALLDVTGRDQQDMRIFLVRDTDTLAWKLDKVETELWKAPPEPILDSIAGIVTADSPLWSGKPTELCDLLQIDLKPNALTQKLNVNAERLREEYNILYSHKRGHCGRQITLTFIG